ncbi:phosphotransferase family protein [Frankia sp. AiPs1]|uniref:phosphotransferase family protein n=1 Tax=Frankia sp. AiPs1 TaxID=573493 RepID=UPI002043F8B9|nr:phosphotransferase family protein [Frankia sp. AiPs1]MCM3920175.1 phosphotransferase family protein [Frankia sp. AiPs1]
MTGAEATDGPAAAARTAEEDRLVARVEELVGGRVTAIERQPRWRKAWYLTVDRDGTELALYVRGDKQIDAEPYPGLDREAAILRILERNGVPVPHVHGMSSDPIGIVMDRVPGTRDVAEAADDDERRGIAEQYMEILARMHGIDVAEFAAAGIEVPTTPAGAQLAFVDANERLYRRTKKAAEPLVEWALRWARRRLPTAGNRARFIHGDTGQFLFVDGRITCVYDFEASHIGDPLSDLAGLRTRAGTEPLGADIEHMIRHYQRVAGTTVDPSALSFYTATYMLTAVMALSGPLTELRPADQQAEYLTWDLMVRRAMLWAIAEVEGVKIEPAPPVTVPTGYPARIATVLEGTVRRMVPATPVDEANQSAALALARWAGAMVAVGAANVERDLDRAAVLLGHRPADQAAADTELERFVLAAGPEHDVALLEYFAAQTEARVAEAVPMRARLEQYALPKVVL